MSGISPNTLHQQLLGSDRIRAWLDAGTPYECDCWKVHDTGGQNKTRELDFAVPMPDGKLLSEHTRLYQTAKELVFWLREDIYTSFTEVFTHRNYYSIVVQLCYWVVERRRSSFAELSALDIEEMVGAAAFGADRVYGASTKVRTFLSRYDTWESIPNKFRKGREFERDAVIAACNLPKWRTPKLNFEFEYAAARLNGNNLPQRPQYFDEMLTDTRLRSYLTVIEALFVFRQFMRAEGLLFKPFPNGVDAAAKTLGRSATKVPIAPINLVLKLLEESVIVVTGTADIALSDYKTSVLGRLNGNYKHFEAIAARKQLIKFASACYVLIAAFTARRTEEIRLIERDCLAGNDQFGWWMKVFIVKNHKNKTWIPVPNIVAKAVKSMQNLDFQCNLAPTDPLFRFFDPILNRVSHFHIHLTLDNYASSVNACSYLDSEETSREWHWQTRQFRRFFAVLFLYRYQGSIEALSHHLRHFNLEMTRSYLTLDPELSAIWLNEEWGFKKKLATAIATGDTSYTGAVGDRLKKTAKKLVEKFYGSLVVV